jgi:hypothetical protein
LGSPKRCWEIRRVSVKAEADPPGTWTGGNQMWKALFGFLEVRIRVLFEPYYSSPSLLSPLLVSFSHSIFSFSFLLPSLYLMPTPYIGCGVGR